MQFQREGGFFRNLRFKGEIIGKKGQKGGKRGKMWVNYPNFCLVVCTVHSNSLAKGKWLGTCSSREKVDLPETRREIVIRLFIHTTILIPWRGRDITSAS